MEDRKIRPSDIMPPPSGPLSSEGYDEVMDRRNDQQRNTISLTKRNGYRFSFVGGNGISTVGDYQDQVVLVDNLGSLNDCPEDQAMIQEVCQEIADAVFPKIKKYRHFRQSNRDKKTKNITIALNIKGLYFKPLLFFKLFGPSGSLGKYYMRLNRTQYNAERECWYFSMFSTTVKTGVLTEIRNKINIEQKALRKRRTKKLPCRIRGVCRGVANPEEGSDVLWESRLGTREYLHIFLWRLYHEIVPYEFFDDLGAKFEASLRGWSDGLVFDVIRLRGIIPMRLIMFVLNKFTRDAQETRYVFGGGTGFYIYDHVFCFHIKTIQQTGEKRKRDEDQNSMSTEVGSDGDLGNIKDPGDDARPPPQKKRKI